MVKRKTQEDNDDRWEDEFPEFIDSFANLVMSSILLFVKPFVSVFSTDKKK